MPRAVYVVYSSPASPDREDEYNDWYDQVHLGEVCAIDGVSGATRYELAGVGGDDSTTKYLAVYQIEADDPQAVIDDIAVAAGDGRLNMSDVLQMEPPPDALLYVERDR